MTSIAYFPVVERADDLLDIVSRAAWFLSFCPVQDIYVPVASSELAETPWSVAPGMDPAIEGKFPALREKLKFVVVDSEAPLEEIIRSSDMVMKWKLRASPDYVSAEQLARWTVDKKVWRVDPEGERLEGSFYIEVSKSLLSEKEVAISESKAKFTALFKRLGKFRRAYVMATGPSVWRYRLFDYTDAISVICNSVILDEDLMRHAKPKILVFADPIFHFGPSQYAAAFRAQLRQAVHQYGLTIVIPFKYFAIFSASMPDLIEHTIAVPFEKEMPFNLDLNADFCVKTTANILTLLMNPIAATFADEVCVLGCDGRPLHEDEYFWGHNKKTQINDKMSNIQAVHPGFFNIDYNEYYLEHCELLEQQCCVAESLGKLVKSVGFSYIPALAQRLDSGPRSTLGQPSDIPETVVLLDPDAKSWAGHYMAYNERLCGELASRGIDVSVFCRTDLSADILATRRNFVPCFSSHSWAVGNRVDNTEQIQSFKSELRRTLFERYAGKAVRLYMYCGSLEHAKVLAEVCEEQPNVSVNINLFWASFTLSEDYAKRWQDFISWLDASAGTRAFRATLPTREVALEMAQYTGCVLPVAPHPSTGVTDEMFAQLVRNNGQNEETARVIFPGSPRPEKGYLLSVEAVKLLGSNSGLQPVLRYAPSSNTPDDIIEAVKDLPKRVEIVRGELSDEEFLDLFRQADICVLPYSRESFSNRTSGLLIDALYHGVPCVVLEGTWLAGVVAKHQCGVVVRDGDATAMSDGVNAIFAEYPRFQQNVHLAAEQYFQRNSWSALVDEILDGELAKKENRRDSEGGCNSMVGPYSRDDCAHWDETNCVAKLYDGHLSGSIMIDVGAHHGSALMPFLRQDWRVFAFEPDEVNRGKLLERLSNQSNANLVTIDQRCVSNESTKGVAFFRSEQSTGISGLSAFHETHIEAQKVDTVTLQEFLSDFELSSVDFLKIDTEGHDLFVLQGFPWHRVTPAVIECEFEDGKTVPLGYTFHDLADYLVTKGYTVYVSEWHPIVRYGQQHDWNRLFRYPGKLTQPEAWGNLLAFRDPIQEDVLVEAVESLVKLKKKPGKGQLKTIQSQHAVTGNAPPAGLAVSSTAHFSGSLDSGWQFSADDAARNFIIASIPAAVRADHREIGCAVRLKSSATCKARLTVGRHGANDWEGSSESITLHAGYAKELELSHWFRKHHDAVKFQIEILDVTSGVPCTISLESLKFYESLESIRNRFANDQLGVALANRLFREHDLLSAYGVNQLLFNQRKLRMYRDNMAMIERKLAKD